MEKNFHGEQDPHLAEQAGEAKVKEFETLVSLVDSLTASARNGDVMAVEVRRSHERWSLAPSSQPDVYTYGVKEYYYGNHKYSPEAPSLHLVDIFLEPGERERAKEFILSYFETGGSMNGSEEEARTFQTRIPGITLQVYKWEEWWQMMGGAHLGGKTILWLVNHEPISKFKKT